MDDGLALAIFDGMAQQHFSSPGSSRFPRVPRALVHTGDDWDDGGAPAQSVPIPLNRQIPNPHGPTRRHALTESKLPSDAGASTYVGGANDYRGETFDSTAHDCCEQTVAVRGLRRPEDEVPGSRGCVAPPNFARPDVASTVDAEPQLTSGGFGRSKTLALGVTFAAAGVILLLLVQPYAALAALLAGGALLYLGRRSRGEPDLTRR